MNEDKKKVIMGLLENSTKVDVMGTSRFSEARVVFMDILPAIIALRNKYPQAGAPKIVARINKVMNQNGSPKFKLSTNNLTKWFLEATGERFCNDPKAIARGEKLKASRKNQGAAPVSRPIFPEEPDPVAAVDTADGPIGLGEPQATTTAAPIGLEQVAGMTEDDLSILEGEPEPGPEAPALATPPDPFGDV